MTDTKSDKGSLTVSVALGNPASQAVPLPVELIGLRSKGYARGLINDEISVSAGKYFVQITLPDGRKIAADEPVQVVAGAHNRFAFDLLSEGLAPPKLEADPEGIREPTVGPSLDIESEGLSFAAGISAKTRVAIEGSTKLWRGDLLDMWTTASLSFSESADRGALEGVRRLPTTAISNVMDQILGDAENVSLDDSLRIQRSSHPTTALLLLQGGRACAFIVPFDERYGTQLRTTISWRPAQASEPSLDYDLGNARTNAFLSFVRRGERAVARDLSLRGLRDEAGELADGKSNSPLGAALGVYVLLRINELEELDRCTANLYSHFPWLPDALAIRVEYLARSGDHRSAVDLLRHANLRGGPWFRSGMNYLIDRLGLYLEIDENERADLGITPDVTEFLNQQRNGLKLLGRYLDPSETVCAFRALPNLATESEDISVPGK